MWRSMRGKPVAVPYALLLSVMVALAVLFGGSGNDAGTRHASATGTDTTGVYNVLVEVTPSDFIHCITATYHDAKGTQATNGRIVCYFDTPGFASPPPAGSAVPSRSDGIAGPPPPPPYSTRGPQPTTGSFDPTGGVFGTDGTSTSNGCAPDVGSIIGPHQVSQSVINSTTNTGTVNAFIGQTFANCVAGTPLGTPAFSLPLTVTQKSNDVDTDLDGCKDREELGIDLTDGSTDPADRPKGCGDDPYNPYDSDDNINSVSTLSVTLVQEDRDIAGGEDGVPGIPDGATCYDGIDNGAADGADALDPNDCGRIPGAYFFCAATTDHNKTTGALRTRLYCYTDSTSIEVNGAANPGVLGTGSAGTPPPLPFGDVDDSGTCASCDNDPTPEQTQLSGSVTGNKAAVEGCFEGVDSVLGPNVWVTASFDIHTGVGLVQIWAARADCSDADPDNDVTTDPPTFQDVLLEVAEQLPRDNADSRNDWDNDQDGCSDTTELGDSGNSGGLRDPFNVYDFFDPDGNRSVAFPDFLQVLQHFNTNSGQPGAVPLGTNPYSAGAVTAAGIYSPRYDRGGQITGSNPWNENYPNGAIGFPDFLSLLRQFGHTCNLHVVPFK